jgi:hypothetical protein
MDKALTPEEAFRVALEHRLTRIETALWLIGTEATIIIPILLYLVSHHA